MSDVIEGQGLVGRGLSVLRPQTRSTKRCLVMELDVWGAGPSGAGSFSSTSSDEIGARCLKTELSDTGGGAERVGVFQFNVVRRSR